MKPEHTPGPWVEHEGFITGRFSDGQIHDICDPRCAPPDGDLLAEMDANARLIAAAPEMLAALLAAERCLCPPLRGALRGYVSPELAAIRAAITKATEPAKKDGPEEIE